MWSVLTISLFHRWRHICCSVTQLCPILHDSMNFSTPGFPVLHNLPEFAQTHVHWISDAIQSSHRLSSASPAFNLFQHQGLFQWVSSCHQVAKVLELQHQTFQWIFRVDIFLVYKQIFWCLPDVCPDILIGFDLVCLGSLIWIVFKLTWRNCINRFIMILKALNRHCARY